jgi:hypothetical protein
VEIHHGWGGGELIRPKVDDVNVREDGLEDADERFVVWMGQIGFPGFLVLERDDEAVGKTLFQAFRAVVLAPFQVEYARDLALEGDKSFLNLLYLAIGGVFLELKGDDMAEDSFFGHGGCGKEEGGKEEGMQLFHKI